MATFPKNNRKPAKPSKTLSLTVRPLDDRVLLRIEAPEEMTPGGIVLPAASQEQSQFARVVRVGPGRPWPEYVVLPTSLREISDSTGVAQPPSHMLQPRYPMSVRTGDRVIIGRFAGVPLEIDGFKFTVVRESDILAVCD